MDNYIYEDHPRMPEYRFGKIRLDQYLKIHSKRVPDKVCVNNYGCEIKWSKMEEYVEKMATYFKSIGVEKGDVVSVFMQSCPQFLIAFYGAQRIGAAVAPFSPMFKAWDLKYEVGEVKSKVIVCNTYLYPIVKEVIDDPEGTTLEHVVVTSIRDFVPEEPVIPFNFNEPEPDSTDDAVQLLDILNGDVNDDPYVETDMEDIGLYMFTSGSTGLPKGAMLAYMAALYKAVATATCYHTTEYTKYLCSQPVYHIAGMVFMNCCIYLGATMYMITKIEAETLIKALDLFKCDYWYASALMNKQIIEYPDIDKYDLTSLRQCVTTSFGIQLTEEIANQWTELTKGGTLVEWAYGLSESHTMDTGTPIGKPKYGTCGRVVFDDMHIKIVDEEGNEVPRGEIGEIIETHPAIFKGYLNNPEATAINLKDGWLYTGDTGMMDEDGYVSFLGRKKEMIKTSGFSVFPEEIEMYVCRHEAVAQAIVIGKPDPKRGEMIKAFCKLKDEYVGKVTEEEIIEWCKDKMATYKRPREIEFIDTVPATGTGKLLRRVLRDEEAKKMGLK